MKWYVIIFAAFLLFIGGSYLKSFEPGVEIAGHFTDFLIFMVKLLPALFILIGLFEVWVKRETVEKHLGDESGIKGYLWALLLAGTSAGGLYVALPIAASLQKKGASLKVIFTFIGAAGVCRIPMTTFEIAFMGPKFTLIRLGISIPLIIISSIILGKILKKESYQLME